MAKRTVEAWIAQALNDPDKDGPCSQISLIHMQGASTGKELHVIKIKIGGQYEPKKMAETFRGRAEGYSQELPGVQTFNLVAFYGKTEPEAFQPFLVNLQSDHMNSGLSTEGPSAEGQTQQRMRQQEMVFQQMFVRQQQQDNRQDRVLDTAFAHIARMQHENMEMFNGMKELIMATTVNREKQQMEMLEYERKTGERGKLLGMVPPLANMLTGREVFPQSTVDTAIIEGLATNLDPQLVQGLLPMIPEAVRGLVAQRFEQVLKKQQEDAAEVKRLRPTYRGTAIAELTGKDEAANGNTGTGGE